MSDPNKTENNMTDNPFFGFARPYFDFIGKGKIYSLVYVVMAVINLLLPILIIFGVIESGLLYRSGTRIVAAFMLSWLVIAFACWIGFQLWWYRRTSVKKVGAAEFVTTPIVSDILQTFGDWLGTMIGIIGAGVGLIGTIVLGRSEPLGYMGYGAINIWPYILVGGPVIGFILIIFFRFLAEQIRIFAAIANNTKDIVRNLKK